MTDRAVVKVTRENQVLLDGEHVGYVAQVRAGRWEAYDLNDYVLDFYPTRKAAVADLVATVAG